MGTNDIANSFLNLMGSWVETDGQVQAWRDGHEPAVSTLPWFSAQWCLGLDLLHIWFLGVGRDMLGTALRILIGDKHFLRAEP